jgi:uncharacterized protein YrzB (UPF0473 family)
MTQEQLLDIYTDYLISQNKYATATGLEALLEGEMSHDKVSRFLKDSEFGSKNLWKYVKPEVRKMETKKKGVLIIDDTIEEKPYTDENEIVCWHFSHSKGRCIKGINLLSCLVRYDDIALPVSVEIVHKEVYFCDEKTKKERRKSSITKNELFRSQIKQAEKNEIQFDYVLADNWFGAKKNMEFINYDIKKKFIFGIKSNRLIAFSEKERREGKYQNLKTLQLEDNQKREVYLKDLAFPVSLMKKSFKNEDGSIGELYLVTNDLEIDAEKIYEIYQKRWRIEEYHKSIKQNASLEKSPTKIVQTQKTHVFASIIAYCKLEILRVKTKLNHFALKYKLIMRANQMAFQELQKMQQSSSFA